MDIFFIIALLVIVSTFYSYLNARFIKLPGTIGIMSLAIVGSIMILLVDYFNPSAAKYLTLLAKNINFPRAMLNIMLGFLLFAGAFNLNVKKLKKEMRPVMLLSTLGVLISTAVFGTLFYYIAPLFHIYVPFIYCLLFGALVSPTDPVAVAAIVKRSNLPPHLSTIITGESLFNDGIGLVLFITLLEITESGVNDIDFAKAGLLFVQEVFGGIAMGLVFGFLANRLMRSIQDFQTIVLVSLSLVMSISWVGTTLHLSVPLAVVSAGLLAGNRSINLEEGERSHQALERFWELIDELLNTILFVLIGIQMINFPFINNYWITGSVAIVFILAARWVSITLPLTFLKRSLNINYGSVKVLTWAGLRGGISIALALSLPSTKYRELILAGTYFIVIFSVIVQGLSLNKVINSIYKKDDA
ncbi:cation:proton antiporter [Mucilaginibacter myungsuensis]|uniref:Sodium:proton antiporter n=1 Tax=Mucilaginibacter myungsuensis TaxID=649104 RepID=A0A929L5L3_9SPHI|nr:sodium:proton antiporter [Mucilaginibacter myungsuensis]MBE9664410.1 sodium:proton antiporter [Mucilaginibacter myungsuensis]MDN3597121.1 sodium:proton antiporter [Mucilaginibacter myungsuensis]